MTTKLQPTGFSARNPKHPELVLGQAVAGGQKPVTAIEQIASIDLREAVNTQWDLEVETTQETFLRRSEELQDTHDSAQLKLQEKLDSLKAKQEALEQEHNTLADASELEVKELEQKLHSIQLQATEAWGKVGLFFDPAQPRPELPFVRPAQDSDGDTEESALIHPEKLSAARTEKVISWICVTLTGFSTGASFYMASGGDFGFRTDPITFPGFLSVGLAVIILLALTVGRGSRILGRTIGRQQILATDKFRFIRNFSLVFGTTFAVIVLLLVAMEATTAYEGIISQILKQDVNRYFEDTQGNANGLVFWLLAFFISGTLATYKALAGFELGQKDATQTLLKEEHAKALESLRNDPDRQLASTLAQQVIVLNQVLSKLQQALSQQVTDILTQIADVEASINQAKSDFQNLEYKLSTELQQAEDNAVAARQVFYKRLDDILLAQHKAHSIDPIAIPTTFHQALQTPMPWWQKLLNRLRGRKPRAVFKSEGYAPKK